MNAYYEDTDSEIKRLIKRGYFIKNFVQLSTKKTTTSIEVICDLINPMPNDIMTKERDIIALIIVNKKIVDFGVNDTFIFNGIVNKRLIERSISLGYDALVGHKPNQIIVFDPKSIELKRTK